MPTIKTFYNHPDFHSMHLIHQIIICESKTIKNVALVNGNAFMNILRNKQFHYFSTVYTVLVYTHTQTHTQRACACTHTHTHS